jgi:predicted amidophosphoribosyltransferase
MDLKVDHLEFGALLTYTPRGSTPQIQNSRNVMLALKKEGFVNNPPVLMSEWLATALKTKMSSLTFASFFNSNTILVPVPKSSLMQKDTLWVPEKIANAMVKAGIGKQVECCLSRAKPVQKAASSSPSERPTALQHYESLCVQSSLCKPEEIILVDDVITRGATILGCANRLVEAFPQCQVRAFAAMRTISNPHEFEKVVNPCIGTIDLYESGDTFRRP